MTDSTFNTICRDERFWQTRIKRVFPDLSMLKYAYGIDAKKDLRSFSDCITALRYIQYEKWCRIDHDRHSDATFAEFKELIKAPVSQLGDSYNHSPHRWLKIYGQKRPLTEQESDILIWDLAEFGLSVNDLYNDLIENNNGVLPKKYAFLDDVYNMQEQAPHAEVIHDD